RMMRAAMIEALESDYVEMARLKGVPEWQIVLTHALPNSIAPTIQVIGLNFLYLAGGVVVVEYVFNYPGIGQGLVFAGDHRDFPGDVFPGGVPRRFAGGGNLGQSGARAAPPPAARAPGGGRPGPPPPNPRGAPPPAAAPPAATPGAPPPAAMTGRH